jgi:hypothetical protein
VAFVVGLFVSNTVVAVAGRVGVLGASRRVGTRVVLSVVVAAFSVALGIAMMVGFADRLPALAGG